MVDKNRQAAQEFLEKWSSSSRKDRDFDLHGYLIALGYKEVDNANANAGTLRNEDGLLVRLGVIGVQKGSFEGIMIVPAEEVPNSEAYKCNVGRAEEVFAIYHKDSFE